MISTRRVKVSATFGSGIGRRYRGDCTLSTIGAGLRRSSPQSSFAVMARVELYTTPSCPFCVRAKRLLAARHVPYDEIDVAEDDVLREELVTRTGRRTVPQIFIDGQSVGGFEELAALDTAEGLAAFAEEADDGA